MPSKKSKKPSSLLRAQLFALLGALALPNAVLAEEMGNTQGTNIQSAEAPVPDAKQVAAPDSALAQAAVATAAPASAPAGLIAEPALELPDAMVSATRTFRRAVEVPRAVNLVGQAALADRMPRNSAEALREEAGIAVQKTEHGGGNAIIRGMGSNQVLLLVDGVRLNNSTYRFGHHPYLTTVDNHMLERMEVVRGPGSVLYGSDAMGGTVNLVTRQPLIGKEAALEAHGRAYARYATADGERILRADGALAGAGFGLEAGATLRETGDLERGGTGTHDYLFRSDKVQPNSGYSGRDYDAKLAWRLAQGQTLSLALQRTERPEIPRFDRYENEGYYRWVYTPQERDLAYINYQGGTAAVPMRAFLSWHRQEEGREYSKSATSAETREWGEVKTYGVGVQADHAWKNHAFTAGMDAYLDRIDSRRELVNPVTGAVTPQILALYPDGSYHGSYGAFLQDEVRLGRAWTATAGARWSLYRLDFAVPYDPKLAFDWNRVEEDFQAVTGSLGLSWNFAEGLYANANVAQGFHAPNMSDLAKTGESKGTTYEIPNPELGPEDIVSMDAGIKIDKERVKGAFFVHNNLISNLMASAPTTYNGSSTYITNGQTYNLQSKQNIGEGYVRGVEAEALVRAWSKLWVRANFTYTEGRNETRDDYIGSVPPAMGLLGVHWKADRYAVEAFSRFAGDQYKLSADDKIDPRIQPGGTPGWATLNLRGNWKAVGKLRLSLGLENVLDQNYREHASGINAPGRNFTAGFDWGI